MSLRHRLIRWLACGDAIIMNVEILRTGAMRSRNVGYFTMYDCRLSVMRDRYSLLVGPSSASALIHIEPSRGNMTIENCEFVHR